MKLRVNRLSYPVMVLGPGRRLGLWVQGCRIRCAGCASTDTWDPAAGQSVDTAELAAECAALVKEHRLSGLTITGGEPTEQAVALADLVQRLQTTLGAGNEPVDCLMFTGVSAAVAQRRAASLWSLLDAAVCGPYRPDQPSNEPLLASANQELVTLTALGQARFDQATLAQSGKSLQARVANGDISMVGLPGPGDLVRIEEALRQRGIVMDGRSWQAV